MSENPPPEKTSLGIDENVAGVLCYVLGWLTGIIFLVIEQDNRFVRFHALQSIAVFLPISVAAFILGFFPFIGGLLSFFVWMGGFALWILLMVQAARGLRYKLPIAGDFAEGQLR